MCTVSFVGFNNHRYMTSNRDEQTTRPVAKSPEIIKEGKRKIIFPRDPKAGGTWFIADDSGKVAVLLNGAETKHIPLSKYRKSRGLILMEIMKAENSFSTFETINLNEIEPFTIILFENKKLHQLRWNYHSKSMLQLDELSSYIWSSSTLYDQEVIEKREKLFNNFLKNQLEMNEMAIIDFHKSPRIDSLEEGFLINREEKYKTFSITQAKISDLSLEFTHIDLLSDQIFHNELALIPSY